METTKTYKGKITRVEIKASINNLKQYYVHFATGTVKVESKYPLGLQVNDILHFKCEKVEENFLVNQIVKIEKIALAKYKATKSYHDKVKSLK